MAKKVNSKNGGRGQKQAFAFSAPGAMSVQLVGDFTHWQEHPINLQKGADLDMADCRGIGSGHASLPFSRGRRMA